MAKKQEKKGKNAETQLTKLTTGRPSALVDTRIIYFGDNLEQPRLPEGCVDCKPEMDL